LGGAGFQYDFNEKSQIWQIKATSIRIPKIGIATASLREGSQSLFKVFTLMNQFLTFFKI